MRRASLALLALVLHASRARARPAGANVCGGRCCPGWMSRPGPLTCTVPICFPPCKAGGRCVWPGVCASSALPGPPGVSSSGSSGTSRSGSGGRRRATKESHHILSHVIVANSGGAPHFATPGGKSVEEGPALDLAAAAMAAASGGPGPPAHVLQAMRDAAQRLLGSGSTGTVMVKVQRQTVDPRHWKLFAATSPRLVHSVNRLRNSVNNANLHKNAAGTSRHHHIISHKPARPQELRASRTYGLYNNVLPPGPPAPRLPSLTPKGIEKRSQVQVISPSPSCSVRCNRGRCRRVCDSTSRISSAARQNAPPLRISSPPTKPFRPMVTQRRMRRPPTPSPQIVCPKGFSADETGRCRVAASRNYVRRPKPNDGGRAQCYREVDSAGCSLPLALVVPHLMCCCVLGKAWGPGCQRCPTPGSDEFHLLCPPSFSFSQENKGRPPPSQILTPKFREAVPYVPVPKPPTTSFLSARLPLGPKISSLHFIKIVQAPAVTIQRVVPMGPNRGASQVQTQLRKQTIAAAAGGAGGGGQRGTHHHRVHLLNGGGGQKENAENIRHHHIVRIPQVPNAPITLSYDRSTIPSKKGSEYLGVRAEHQVVPLAKEVHKHGKPMGHLDLRSHHHKGSRVRPGQFYPSSPVAINLMRFQQSRRLEEAKGAMGPNKRPVQDHRMGEQTLPARYLQEKLKLNNLGRHLPESNVNIVAREEGADVEADVDMTHQEHNEFTTWKIDALPNWQPESRFQQQANIQPSKKELQPKDIREVVTMFQETTGNPNAEGSSSQDLHISPTNSWSTAIDNYLHSPISQQDFRFTGHTTYVPLKVETRSQAEKENGTHVLDHKLQNNSEIPKLDGNVSYGPQREHMTDVELKGDAYDASFGKNGSEGIFEEHKANASQGHENIGSVDKGHDEDSGPEHLPATPPIMWHRGEEVTGKHGSLHLHVKTTSRGSNITQPERLRGTKSREDGSSLVQGKDNLEYEQSRMFPRIKEREEYMPARRLANSHILGESKLQGKEDSSIWQQEEIRTPGSNIAKEKHLHSDHEQATPVVRWHGSAEAVFKDGEPEGLGEAHFENYNDRKPEINQDRLDSWRATVPNYLAYRRPETPQGWPGGLKERKPNAPVEMWHHRLENVRHESGEELKVQGWELKSRESDRLETLQIDRLEEHVHEQKDKMKESWRLGWSEAQTVSVPASLGDFKSTGFGPPLVDGRQAEQWGSKSEGKDRAERWRPVWTERLKRPEQRRVGLRESHKEDSFKNWQGNRKLGELIGRLEGHDHALLGGQTRLGSARHTGYESGVPGELERAACFLAVEEGAECGAALASNLTLQECCCTLGGIWGSCHGQPCPAFPSEELSSLCPGGRGYIPVDPMRPDLQPYQDADECLLFERTACRGGFCVNQQGGFLCHCRDGFYYDFVHLACYDVDECSDEGRCMDGECVNTPGSYSCFCHPPQVLDPSGQACLNGSEPAEDDISVHLDVCWNIDVQLMCSELVQRQTTYTECCCLFGQAWGMECALCPLQSSEDYAQLCNLPRAGGSRATERRDFFEPHFLPDGDEELPLPDFMYHDGADSLRETAPLHGPGVLEMEMPADECGVLSGCENGRCIRVQHGYTCQCHEGYRLHTARMACLDVDECEQKPPPCGTDRCLNSPGSYSCL
uniref:uncharacterized protein isoform X2 n=1 Tax=Myxine glutinosa TaxID=7769 RepID=UPI00358E562C